MNAEVSECFSDREYSQLPENSKFLKTHDTIFMLLKLPTNFEESELQHIGLHYGESAGPLNGNASRF